MPTLTCPACATLTPRLLEAPSRDASVNYLPLSDVCPCLDRREE
jgi:hypothetical protein